MNNGRTTTGIRTRLVLFRKTQESAMRLGKRLALVATSIVCFTSVSPAQEVSWHKSLDDAFKAAGTSDKPVLALFWAEW